MNEIPGAYRPNQYFNPTNPLAHYESTGPEIWRQTDGTVTHFVAGGGTGGTLSGVSRYLKEQNPAIQVICADPEGSVYSGGSGRPYLVEGVGEDFWPTTYHPDLIDRVIPISDADSFAMARRVSQESLLIGGSCGTAVAAALQVADECTPDDLIVVLTPDSGRGYLSKVFNDDWMGGFGFLRADGPVVSDIIDRRNTDVPELLYVQPHQKVSEAVAIMRDNGVSQLPVGKGEMPLAAAEIAGSVSELRLMELAFETDAVLDKTVEDVGGTVAHHRCRPTRRPCGRDARVVLCNARARWRPPRAVVSSTDVLNFLSDAQEPERWPMTFSPMPRCSASNSCDPGRSASRPHQRRSRDTDLARHDLRARRARGPPGL